MWISHSSPGFTVIVFRYLFTLEVTGNASHEESQWDGRLLAIALNKRVKPYTQSVGERTEYEVWVCVGNYEKRMCVCLLGLLCVGCSCINPWSIHALLHQAYNMPAISQVVGCMCFLSWYFGWRSDAQPSLDAFLRWVCGVSKHKPGAAGWMLYLTPKSSSKMLYLTKLALQLHAILADWQRKRSPARPPIDSTLMREHLQWRRTMAVARNLTDTSLKSFA